MTNFDDEKTPIFMHPAQKESLLQKGCDFFNDEKYFEAHEEWEKIWVLETGSERVFLQGLIQAAAHLLQIQKQNWSAANSLGQAAFEKLRTRPSQKIYTRLDIFPLTSGLEYNLLKFRSNELKIDDFLFPKLFRGDV